VLLVQGAAGSGKTAAALHRVAYLAYTHNNRFSPGDFFILGPSSFFLGCVSGVLPGLGVEGARQLTYEQFVGECLRTKLKVENPAARLERILLGLESDETPRRKSSLAYRDALDTHLDSITERALPAGPFKAGAFTVCSARELRELFHVSFAPRPLAERKALLKNRLLYLCRERAARVFAAIDGDRKRKIAALRAAEPAPEQFRGAKARIIGEHEAVVSDLSRGGLKAVNAYLANIQIPTAAAAYAEFLGGKPPYDYEDLAALLHLNLRLHGTGRVQPAFHLILDEAQDYSPFQLAAVREALGHPSCTLLGDLAQGIFGYRGVSSWNDLLNGPHTARELTMSYRTTVEIMEAALAVLNRLGPLPAARPNPVIRHGPPVEYRTTVSLIERAGEAAEAVNAMLSDGYVNIAVICRTSQTCEKLAGRLKTRVPGLYGITMRDKIYQGGTVLIPAALTKGLEFDGAVIADASDYGDTPRDVKLLYVAMTRAKDMLFLTMAPRYEQSLLRRLRTAAIAGARASASSASCLGDWVLTALSCHPDGAALRGLESLSPFRHQGELFSLSIAAAPSGAPRPYRPGIEAETPQAAPLFTEAEIRAAVNYVYPHEASTLIPSKQTAAAEGAAFERPAFVRERMGLTAAERGSALHLTLQLCGYAACTTAEGAAREVERLLAKSLLTREQAAAVDTAALSRFFSGPWGQPLLNASHVLREQAFTLLRPLPDLPGESVLLQGVIDCAYATPEGWVLLDFKTGSAGAERLEQYRAQVRSYAEALEAMTGRPVVRRVLYFFATGEGVDA
jgi:DNA helicase-2/ATP-dependent DNA helicase PcrA